MSFTKRGIWGWETSRADFEVSMQVSQPNQPQSPTQYFSRFNQPLTALLKPTGIEKQDGSITIRIKGRYELHGDQGGSPQFRGPKVDYEGSFEYLYTINYHFKSGNVHECTGVDQNTLTLDTPQLQVIKEATALGDKTFVLSQKSTEISEGDGSTADQQKFVKIVPYWKLPPDNSVDGDGFRSGTSKSFPEAATSFGELLLYVQVDPFMDKAIVPQRLLDLSRGLSGFFNEDQRKIDAHDKTVTPPIIEWKTRLEQEYPKIFEALRNHKIPLFIAGYASKTGDKWYNYVLSADRAVEVQKALRFLIGGNADVDPNPQGKGQEQAQWDIEVDLRKLTLKLRPRAQDRVVAFWLDRDALTKVYQDLNPCPKVAAA